MRQIGDETASNRIGHPSEDDRDGARDIQRCRDHGIRGGEDHVRRKPRDFLGHEAHPLLAFTGEPIIEADVAAVRPAEVLQGLPEGRQKGLPNLVVLGKAHNDADTPHTIALLRKYG